MKDALEFISVKQVRQHESCGIEILFSDGTTAFFPPEELAALRPHRESMRPERFH